MKREVKKGKIQSKPLKSRFHSFDNEFLSKNLSRHIFIKKIERMDELQYDIGKQKMEDGDERET